MVDIAEGFFCDRAPGRGLITLLTPPDPCTFSTAPVNLGNLSGGSGSAAWGTSRDGSIVVGFGVDSGGVQRALTWTNQSAPVDIGTLTGGSQTRALGCSYDGSVIVGRCVVAGTVTAVVWTNGTPAALTGLPASTANSTTYCSSDGTIVVGSSTVAGVSHAVFWTNGVITDLGLGGGTTANAQGCSADGSIVVGHATIAGVVTAVKWTNGGAAVVLGTTPGGTFSRALKCSANGGVIVGDAGASAGVQFAVYWDSTGVHILDTDTVLPQQGDAIATGVSADGSVIGGYSQDGNLNYWPLVWRNTVPTVMRIGAVTGSELITNGTFTGGSTGWTLGNNVVYSNNTVISTYAGGDPSLDETSVVIVSGKIYEMTFTVTANSPSDNGTTFYLATDSFDANAYYGNGTWSVVFLASSTSTDTVTFDDWNYNVADTWTLDNVSLKELTATARPSINLEVQNISPDGEVIVGQGNYNSGSFPVGALEWLCA